MAKTSDWQSGKRPLCPNNPRHGELTAHQLGGLVCRVCEKLHTPRSRVSYRWT